MKEKGYIFPFLLGFSLNRGIHLKKRLKGGGVTSMKNIYPWWGKSRKTGYSRSSFCFFRSITVLWLFLTFLTTQGIKGLPINHVDRRNFLFKSSIKFCETKLGLKLIHTGWTIKINFLRLPIFRYHPVNNIFCECTVWTLHELL